jgi:acetyl-CoA carboxylase carboxyltransferase component
LFSVVLDAEKGMMPGTMIKQREYQSAPWKAAERHFIDDVIDPRNTRAYINRCLDLLRGSGRGFISKKLLQNWPSVI